jgi:hypothetical protein
MITKNPDTIALYHGMGMLRVGRELIQMNEGYLEETGVHNLQHKWQATLLLPPSLHEFHG